MHEDTVYDILHKIAELLDLDVKSGCPTEFGPFRDRICDFQHRANHGGFTRKQMREAATTGWDAAGCDNSGGFNGLEQWVEMLTPAAGPIVAGQQQAFHESLDGFGVPKVIFGDGEGAVAGYSPWSKRLAYMAKMVADLETELTNHKAAADIVSSLVVLDGANMDPLHNAELVKRKLEQHQAAADIIMRLRPFPDLDPIENARRVSAKMDELLEGQSSYIHGEKRAKKRFAKMKKRAKFAEAKLKAIGAIMDIQR